MLIFHFKRPFVVQTNGLSLFRASARRSRRTKSLPAFAEDERDEQEGGKRIGPGLFPKGVQQHTRQRDPGQITAEGGFGGVCPQSRAGGGGGGFPFLAVEPRHDGGGKRRHRDSGP